MPDRNAAAQRVVSVAKTMREAGFNVDFIGVTHNSAEVDFSNNYIGFNYTSVPYPTGLIQWLYYLTRFVSIKQIENRKPDCVVLYNFPAIAQGRIIRFCHRNNIKVIADLTEWYFVEGFSLHDIVKRLDVRLRMYKYNFQVDGIIAISRYLYDYYNNKIRSIYIPATVDLSDPKWHRDRKIEINRPIRLVYAGSPGGKWKERIDELVSSVQGRTGFILKVFGISEQQFRSVYNVSYIPINVIFYGRVSHLEATRMVCDSDFEIIMRDDNIVTKAGFPTKFVEALSCGTPVIATKSSNICDYLIDGKNGFVINEFQTLEQSLDRISQMSDEERQKMKHEALAVKDFDFRHYVENVKKILEYE